MVKVSCELINRIMDLLGSTDYESGGLLGSSNGDVVDTLYFDIGRRCSYTDYFPNVSLWEEQLQKWSESQIQLVGIIHSHINSEKLSEKDVVMARRVVTANSLECIQMPVFVLNEKRIVWYEVSSDYVNVLSFEVNE